MPRSYSPSQIIEKRRRDRINNCLVELRRLVPAAFEKQVSECARRKHGRVSPMYVHLADAHDVFLACKFPATCSHGAGWLARLWAQGAFRCGWPARDIHDGE